jgi:hypothetical protein
MPSLTFSQALTANQLGYNPLSGWQYEFIPAAWMRGAAVRILVRASTTGTRLTLFSGSQTIQQRSPIQGGGTAGVTPSELNTPPVSWVAMPGDRIIPQIDEVAGGTPTVDGIVQIEPL